MSQTKRVLVWDLSVLKRLIKGSFLIAFYTAAFSNWCRLAMLFHEYTLVCQLAFLLLSLNFGIHSLELGCLHRHHRGRNHHHHLPPYHHHHHHHPPPHHPHYHHQPLHIMYGIHGWLNLFHLGNTVLCKSAKTALCTISHNTFDKHFK